MNILWIADFNTNHHLGGAQRSDKIMIDYGRSLGHNITEFNYDNEPDPDERIKDIIISSNIFILHKKYPKLIEWLSEQKNHIRYEHDSNAYLSLDDRKKLFDNTTLTFFSCKLHADAFIKHYGINPHIIRTIAEPVDGNKFIDRNENRILANLYVGTLHDHKGMDGFVQLIQNNLSEKFIIVTMDDSNKYYMDTLMKCPNVTMKINEPYEDMVDIYNKYTNFHLYPVGVPPLNIEPFCRVVAEAALCGMCLDVGSNVGAKDTLDSVGIDEFRRRCTDAPRLFWEEVGNA